MERSEREGTQVANNRLAVVVAAGSLLVLVALVVLSVTGSLSRVLPERLPTVELLPLYAIGICFLIALVIWSWDRIASFF